MTLPKFLTTAQLAESLQVSESKVIKMREDGTVARFGTDETKTEADQ